MKTDTNDRNIIRRQAPKTSKNSPVPSDEHIKKQQKRTSAFYKESQNRILGRMYKKSLIEKRGKQANQ